MELEITTKQEASEGMELLKADVLDTVGHELRGPLAAIKGYAMTLLRHERHLAREERHQYLQAINEASDRLEVIVERLLEVSWLETGQLTLQLSPVDIAYLVNEAVAAIQDRVANHFPGRFTFHVRMENASGTPASSIPLVLADPRRLREVLDNLLDNAIQYSPEGGAVSVVMRPVVMAQPAMKSVSGSNGRASQKMLEICVDDEGRGIPADQLERIFHRFHRIDTRLIREANGLGLGLTICKYLVELHHGVIWAENKPGGKGSVFHLRLPLSDEPLM